MKLVEVTRPGMTKELKQLMILLTSLTDWKFEHRDPGDKDEHWFWAQEDADDALSDGRSSRRWISVTQIGNNRINVEMPATVNGRMSQMAEKITKAITRAGMDVHFREGNQDWLS